MKPTQRIGAMLLISSMLLTGVSVAEEPSNPPAATEALVTAAPTEAPTATPAPENPTDVPTTTPAPENPTEAPTATPAPENPTEAPTATPDPENPTEAPSATPAPENPTDEPTATPAPENPTDEPTATPTPENPTDEPTATPAPENPTDAPTATPDPENPTDEPTATPDPENPTDEPTATPDPENPTDEPTATPEIPTCDVEGCAHISQDENGLDYPLCRYGRYLLDEEDAYSVATLSNDLRIVDLNRADVTFYRSGQYALIGDRKGAAVRVVKNRAAILELRGASIDTLTVEANAVVYIRAADNSLASIKKLEVASGAAVIFSEGGAISIGTVNSKGDISVEGTNLFADLTEMNGRARYAFSASGVQSVLVEGERYAWSVTPDADGKLYLWLKRPGEGMQWTATVTEGTMTLRQTAKAPSGDAGSITPGERNTLKSGTVYTLSGDIAEGTVLEIMESGVTVILDGTTSAGTLIEAGAPYDLIVRGDTILDGRGQMPLMGSAPKITVDGLLSVQGQLPNGTKVLSGVVICSDAPDGYTAWAISVPLARQKVTLDGTAMPLLMTPAGELLLPALADDATYSISADADTIVIETVHAQVLTFNLSENAPNADAGDASRFIVNGQNGYLDGVIHSSGAAASATLRNVQLNSASSVLRVENGALSATLTGSCALLSDGAPIALDNAQVSLNVESGRLVLRNQNDLTGITLRGNVRVEPESDAPHTIVTIRDAQGNPVPNKALTVVIGGSQYRYTTHFDGTLQLWGFGDLTGQDIAATDGETVYSAVIAGKSSSAVTGLEISDIAATDNEDGTLTITFKTTGAKSAGVQVYAGEAPASMPDTYRADAKQYEADGNAVTISGLNTGDVVIYRVYASAEENVALTESNADGFSFSEECFHVHRVKWVPSRTANTTYNAMTYRPRMTLPETASITYSGNNLVGGLPFYVGSYVMHVKIPEGDPIYLPGTVDVAFSIQKIPLTICPDANQQKNEGEADPARFTFTSIGLLDGDVVSGILKREPGEEAGNYNFVLTGLSAADYYTLRLMDDAPQFTILPTEPSWWGGGGERLNPVQQVIERSDGRKMFVTITTQEQLVLSYSELGSVVRNTADDQPRPFTPSLTWNKKTDEVLLRISAEAELNKDAGYVTDSYGNPVYGARTLRFGYMSLRYMNNAGIDAISFSNKNAAVILRLSDFLSADMEKAIKQAGGNLTTTLFRVTIEPVDLPDGAVTGGWNIRTEMVIDRKPTDISSLLPNAQVAVDMEVVAKLLTNLDRYDEKTFDKHFTLRRGAQTQESVFIAPYQDDELEKVAYPSVLFASRYLLMPLAESGVVDVVMVPIEEDAADGSAG